MLFDDSYKTIKLSSTGIYKEKGSKFIAKAYPVANESEIKNILAKIKKEYYDANHHCYAYIFGYDKSAYRMNDDGEPNGTAGRPIYGQLLSYDLTNILIVVIRYFGGTKLGVSGLINAYKTASKDALENSEIIIKKVYDVYELLFNYDQMNEVMKIIKENNIDILQQKFDNQCCIEFKIRKNESDKIYNDFSKNKDIKLTFLRIE